MANLKNNIHIVHQETQHISCSADVLLWNYLDDEHLIPIHGGYKSAYNLYKGRHFNLNLLLTQPPLLPFAIPTLTLEIHHSKYTLYTYAIQIFLVSKTEVFITPKEDNSSDVSVIYKFMVPNFIPGIRKLLTYLSSKWFHVVLSEDLPLRLRRQRVLEAGFLDYVGMPKHKKSNQKESPFTTQANKSNSPYEYKDPLWPPPGSPLYEHPLYSSFNDGK